MPPLPQVTKVLLWACTVMYFLQLALPQLELFRWFALWSLNSGNFLPWQVVTYAFLHADFSHLFFNMLGLWMFGAELERLWGDRRYMQFLLAGVLAAAAAQILMTFLSGRPGLTVGASGALFALLLAYGMLFPNRTLMLLIPPMPIKAKHLVMVFGAISLVFGFIGGGGVAHFAHLGGMVGGFLMIRYWRGQPPFRSRRR